MSVFSLSRGFYLANQQTAPAKKLPKVDPRAKAVDVKVEEQFKQKKNQTPSVAAPSVSAPKPSDLNAMDLLKAFIMKNGVGPLFKNGGNPQHIAVMLIEKFSSVLNSDGDAATIGLYTDRKYEDIRSAIEAMKQKK